MIEGRLGHVKEWRKDIFSPAWGAEELDFSEVWRLSTGQWKWVIPSEETPQARAESMHMDATARLGGVCMSKARREDQH